VSTASVTIDRTSLGKAPLVIADDGTTYRFTEDGVGYVVQSVRITTAPDSADVDGSEIVAFSRDATALPLEFHVFAATSADLADAVGELEEAFYRLTYPVTRAVDGVSVTYAGGPCALVPKRSAVDAGVVAAHFDTFSVTIPLPNPNGA
jgi:hypothetical protein